MRAVLALTVATALLAWSMPARSQGDVGGDLLALDASVDRITAAASGSETEDVREALSREIARLQAEIADLSRLMRWQQDLTRTARTDRAEALRQRLPMSDCLASALEPLCNELTGLFRPEGTSTDASGADPANEGEGRQ